MTVETAPTTTPGVLRGAADYITAFGHAKGRYEASDGRVCPLGALGRVVAGVPDYHSVAFKDDHPQRRAVFDCARTALWVHLGRRDIPTWNDETARTQDEVVTTLRAAADAVEAGAL